MSAASLGLQHLLLQTLVQLEQINVSVVSTPAAQKVRSGRGADAEWRVLLVSCCLLLRCVCVPADRGAAAALPEWSELPAGLQAALVKAWADRRLQQQEGEFVEAATQTPPAQAPVAAPPAGCQLAMVGGSTLQQGGGGVCWGAVQGQGVGGQQRLLLQPYMLPSKAAVVPQQRMQDLRDAVRDVTDLVSMV